MGHHRPVDGQLVVAGAAVGARLHDLLEAGGEGEDRLAGPGEARQGHHGHVGIHQQVEGEDLLLGAGVEAPHLAAPVDQVELVAVHPGQRRRRPGGEDGVLVGDHAVEGGRDPHRAGGVEGVDQLPVRLDLVPAPHPEGVATLAGPVVVLGGQAQLRGLDPQGGVGRDDLDPVAAVLGQPEGGGQDPVVRLVGVEPEGRHPVEDQPVDGHPERPAGGQGDGLPEITPAVDPQPFQVAHHRPGRPPDVVEAALVPVEFLDDGQRDDDVGVTEGVERVRVGEQDARVEDNGRPHTSVLA